MTRSIDTGEFVRLLKLNGQFDSLIEQLVRDKLTVRAAKQHGVVVTAEDIQTRADQFRRIRGLHRATDMNNYLDALNVSLDEFEVFITDTLYQEKMLEQVGTDDAIEEYFKLNSPKFDSIEVSHIVLDTEGKAKEMISYLHRRSRQLRGDGARTFDRRYARRRRRDRQACCAGQLKPDIEAKVFNANAGRSARAVSSPPMDRSSRSSRSRRSIRRRSTKTSRPRSAGCCAKTG